MAQEGLLVTLSSKRYRQLLVIQELCRQQLWMYTYRCYYRIADHLVSLSQPHVRPIVRGKAVSSVEFGVKISVSLVDGVSFVERISWDAYNEFMGLVQQIDAFRRCFGHDLASVHVDQVYCTRDIAATATVEGFASQGRRWAALGPSRRSLPNRCSTTSSV